MPLFCLSFFFLSPVPIAHGIRAPLGEEKNFFFLGLPCDAAALQRCHLTLRRRRHPAVVLPRACPSSYRESTLPCHRACVLPRPAVVSRFVDAPDAAPPRPAYRAAAALPLLSCCCRLARRFSCQAIAFYHYRVLSRSAVASRVALSAAIALRRRTVPRPAVAPEVVLVLPCSAWSSPCLLPSPCCHPAIGPAQPSSRYCLAAICSAATLPALPSSAAAPCCLAVAALLCSC